mgnify:FL=1
MSNGGTRLNKRNHLSNVGYYFKLTFPHRFNSMLIFCKQLIQTVHILDALSHFTGTAGDSLSYHHGMAFSTKDKDNDRNGGSCAVTFKGAWWYRNCLRSNLNGRYPRGGNSGRVTWLDWKNNQYSMKRAEMKIKPVGA